jgi:hypothetical protein
MDINEVVLLAVLIPAGVVLLLILITGIIAFRKITYDFEKMINNQQNKKR